MANNKDYFKTSDPNVMVESDKFGTRLVPAIAGLIFAPVWIPVWLLGKILAIKSDDMSIDTQSSARIFEDQR